MIEAYAGPEAEDGDQDEEYEDGADGEAAGHRVLRRSLRVSLHGDAAFTLHDPADVDEDDEWAGYWPAEWSGMGPERHASFAALMHEQYVDFHALCRPPELISGGGGRWPLRGAAGAVPGGPLLPSAARVA